MTNLPENNCAGFSLVETLVAVFLLAIVSSVTLAVMTGFAGSSAGMEAKVRHLDQVQRMRQTLSADLASAVARPITVDSVTSSFTGTGGADQADRALLLRFSRADSPLEGVAPGLVSVELVEYWLVDSTLVRRSFDRPIPTNNTPFRDYILMQGIERIDLAYMIGTRWLDDWQGASSDVRSLPRVVSIEISERETNLTWSGRFRAGARL